MMNVYPSIPDRRFKIMVNHFIDKVSGSMPIADSLSMLFDSFEAVTTPIGSSAKRGGNQMKSR